MDRDMGRSTEWDELPYFKLDEIWEVFGYSSKSSAAAAIHHGDFPVPTYRMGRFRVADREVVRAYFRKHRSEGAKKLREMLRAEARSAS